MWTLFLAHAKGASSVCAKDTNVDETPRQRTARKDRGHIRTLYDGRDGKDGKREAALATEEEAQTSNMTHVTAENTRRRWQIHELRAMRMTAILRGIIVKT